MVYIPSKHYKYLLESFEFSNLFETPLIVGGGA